MDYFLGGVTSFVISFLIFPVLIHLFSKYNLEDVPGGRKIHLHKVPSMGGVGFIIPALIAFVIMAWPLEKLYFRYVLGAIFIMFIVGLRDDVVEMRASRKLFWQLVSVALVVVFADVRVSSFHGFMGVYELNPVFSYLFSSLVLLVITNGFNLIDGIDGLAGLICSIALAILGTWFLLVDKYSFALMSFVLLGSVISFLYFNWHPAKIFMGDTGSLSLGFFLGTSIIGFMSTNETLAADSPFKFDSSFTFGIALMIYPLYDMARVFTRRMLKGKHPMHADKSHIHHFMIRMGLKHNQVSVTLAFLNFTLVFLVFVLRGYSDSLILPMLTVIVLSLGFAFDQLVLKFLKAKVMKSSISLKNKKLEVKKKVVIELEKQDVDPRKLHLN